MNAGPQLSDDQFAATWQGLHAKLAATPVVADLQQDSEAVRNALGDAPNIADTGVSGDCSIWIRLTDGSPIAIINTTRIVPEGGLVQPAGPVAAVQSSGQTAFAAGGSIVGPPVEAARAVVTAGGGATYALPSSTKAVIGYADNLGVASLPGIQSALTARGYQPAVSASTATLRSAMTDVGVVWISTHGAVYTDRDGISRYGIVTDETLDPTTGACQLTSGECTKNRDDRDAGRLFVGVLRQGGKGFVSVNGAFIAKYWKLAANSVVVIDACNSMDDAKEYFDFQEALRKANAATVLGWKSEVSLAFADKTVGFLFDRVLGANADPHLTPKQRPFSVPEVYESMSKAGKLNDPAGSAVFAMIQVSLTRQSILVPSLRNMEVTEKKDQSELKLIGEFGNVKGMVSVGGQAVQVKSWQDAEIVVALPNSGAASSGPVLPTVNVGGGQEIKGNAVPLSDWRGMYRTRYTQSVVWGKPGLWSELQCTNFHFRGDIHQYRVDPEGPAMAGTVDAKGARSPYVLIGNITADSVCGGSAGGYGDATYGNTTLRTIYNGLSAGSSWIDNAVNPPKANWFFGHGSIQPDAKILILNTAGDMYGVTLTQRQLAPPPAVTLGSAPVTVGLVGLGLVLAPIPLALDSGFNASSGTRTFGLPGGDKADLEYSLHVDPASLPTADTEG